jgi:uncharacterized lipoprotein
MRALVFTVLAIITTAACSGGTGGKAFRDVGPEQSTFLVTPADPLETPPSQALPTPTPGGVNRAEQ